MPPTTSDEIFPIAQDHGDNGMNEGYEEKRNRLLWDIFSEISRKTKERAIPSLTLIPSHPNSKINPTVPSENLDNSFTETLSAVLFFMKEDWVSTHLLLQAFKNALPALREEITGTDQAYDLFKDYVQISNSENSTA
ncbi:hypothetical protein AVEN_34406-1 [Araneus ventricosus]|uniref:Uncharacterized protein n=1 Tax=Araneus ventricosus TaxID=182803 RepID=A0A4Y2G5U4_ARAVE|nr:hypothetical protein AVEN_34406-1 [Araneus ventricosus]